MGIPTGKPLSNAGAITGEQAIRILWQIGHALSAAHGTSPPVLHGCITPADIFLTDDPKTSGLHNCQLRGLGLSRVCDCIEDIQRALCIAPQLIENPSFEDPQIDIYSLGVSVYIALLGGTTRLADERTGHHIRVDKNLDRSIPLDYLLTGGGLSRAEDSTLQKLIMRMIGGQCSNGNDLLRDIEEAIDKEQELSQKRRGFFNCERARPLRPTVRISVARPL